MGDHIMSRPLDLRAYENWDATFGKVEPKQQGGEKYAIGDRVEVEYHDQEPRWVPHIVVGAQPNTCPECGREDPGQHLVLQQESGEKLIIVHDTRAPGGIRRMP